MDQVITLARNDDILKVHSRIEWSDERRVIVVVPRGCKAFNYEHELRLLRRWADEADVPVALVSTAYHINEMAPVVGLPVFPSVKKAQKSRWKSDPPTRALAIRRSMPADDDAPRPRKPLLDRLGLAGWQLLLTLLLFGIASAILVAAALWFIPTASISIVPANLTISDASEVVLDPTVISIDQINAIVPAQDYRREISGTMTISTTRTATAPADYATGEVVFTNLQGTEATIPLGTVVATTSGVTQRYSTTVTATLPSGFNARVNVPVSAMRPGPDGNVGALQVNYIEGPVAAVARVVNVKPLGGGSIREIHIVSTDDRNTLRLKLNADLRRQAVATLQAAIKENVYVVPASVEVIVLGETFDHLVDDPSDTLSMKIDAVASGLVAEYADFERFAERRLLSKLPEGYSVLPGTLRVEADPNARTEGNSAIIKVRSALLATPVVDKGELLEGLYGKPIDIALAQIGERVDLAEPPSLRMTPSWWRWMPNFDFRTELFVKPQAK